MIQRQILDTIKTYAEAYQRFQKLQEEYPHFLAVGDQKTGVIGEFFGWLYAGSIYSPENVKYASDPSQTGWDIEVSGNKSAPGEKIQVKTVSAFSKTRFITRLSPGWNLLYLMYLGKDFMPRGFWIVEANKNVLQGQSCIARLKMRDPDNPRSGSPTIPWGENRVADLLTVIGRQHH